MYYHRPRLKSTLLFYFTSTTRSCASSHIILFNNTKHCSTETGIGRYLVRWKRAWCPFGGNVWYPYSAAHLALYAFHVFLVVDGPGSTRPPQQRFFDDRPRLSQRGERQNEENHEHPSVIGQHAFQQRLGVHDVRVSRQRDSITV